MKWYRVLSGAFAGSIIVVLLGALALTSYHVYHAELAIPLDHVEDWMVTVIALIPVSVILMIANGGFLYLIFSDKRRIFFIGMIAGNLVCIIVTLYFTGTFGKLMQTPPATGDSLFQITKKLIDDQHAKNATVKKWVPKWLDKVQKNNKSCCGVLTFRDWEEFWPAAPESIPQSCCKEPESTTCVTDFQKIPFPGTPSMFIKTDSGCTDAINEEAYNGIRNSFIVMLIVAMLVIGAEVAFAIQYYNQYWPKDKKTAEDSPILPIKTPEDAKGASNDCEDPISVPNNCDESGSGSLVAGTPDLASSSVGSVDTTGSGAQANFGSRIGDPMKFGLKPNQQEEPSSPNGMMKYGPSGISGTIIGAYNLEPATAGLTSLGSSSSSEGEDLEDKPKKRKKKKKKNKKDPIQLEADPKVANGNDGKVKPDMTSEYAVANSEDNLVGDRFPDQQETTPPGRPAAGPRGKILGMARNRK